MGYRGYSYFPKYVPVSERRAKAAKAVKKLMAIEDVKPVVIQGRKIATSWWGCAWNDNLERYSDYSNRLPRGRSYVRNGSVLHLEMTPGLIEALVCGSNPSPYEVKIRIDPLSPDSWKDAVAACSGKLDSVKDLIAGKFPVELQQLFIQRGTGLFPTPKEIHFECSCPDWASMCKHVAAVLYGVGTRLDDDPSLFFSLRGVNQDDLIGEAIRGVANELADRAQQTSDRIMDDAQLGDVFGIEMDDLEFAAPQLPTPKRTAHTPPRATVKRVPAQEMPSRPTTAKTAAKTVPPAPGRQPSQPSHRRKKAEPAKPMRNKAYAQKNVAPAVASGSVLDRVLNALSAARGTTVQKLIPQTGLSETQVRNALARGKAQGQVTTTGKGIYKRVT